MTVSTSSIFTNFEPHWTEFSKDIGNEGTCTDVAQFSFCSTSVGCPWCHTLRYFLVHIIRPHEIPHTDILVLPFTMPLRHCLSGRALKFKPWQPSRTLTCISLGGQLMLVPQS